MTTLYNVLFTFVLILTIIIMFQSLSSCTCFHIFKSGSQKPFGKPGMCLFVIVIHGSLSAVIVCTLDRKVVSGLQASRAELTFGCSPSLVSIIK